MVAPRPSEEQGLRDGGRGGGSGRAGGWGWPGGETPLRPQSWGPRRLSPSGKRGGEIFGGRRLIPHFSEWGEVGPRGRRRLVRGVGPSMPPARCRVSAAPPTALPRPRPPAGSPVPSRGYCKVHLPPGPESILRHKLTLFLARRCPRRVCTCNLKCKIWFSCSRSY